MAQERIGANDTLKDTLIKLAEGNPGAINVMMQIVNKAAIIDPDSALGPFGCLLNLDSFGIYGSRIWMLYKDVCDEDITKTIALLRAVQLGILSRLDIQRAIDNRGNDIDVDTIIELVKIGLPNFGKQV
jgi:hypothetical protein